jgi:hypothetical protein
MSLMTRFHAKVSHEPNTGCWLWTGALVPKGYGSVRDDGPDFKRLGAHVASWKLHHGPVPIGLFVCHRCDVRWCVNPDHLFLGTHQDNMDDMHGKGRAGRARGEAISRADLTAAGVLEIVERRRDGEAVRDIAADFGVTVGAIYHIASGRSWHHITGLTKPRTTSESK